MKEQALKIVSDLIDGHKINGKEAISLIVAILNDSNTQYIPASPIISQPIRPEDISRPYSGTITTTVTGDITDNATRPKGIEVIYG